MPYGYSKLNFSTPGVLRCRAEHASLGMQTAKHLFTISSGNLVQLLTLCGAELRAACPARRHLVDSENASQMPTIYLSMEPGTSSSDVNHTWCISLTLEQITL
jgi:hypothetical protein